MTRRFRWESWNFDFNGDAYIISKDECPEKDNVPDFICREDDIDPACKPEMIVEEGWCKWQVRTDWEDGDGKPHGSYVVEKRMERPERPQGWFPVWIVRKDDWY